METRAFCKKGKIVLSFSLLQKDGRLFPVWGVPPKEMGDYPTFIKISGGNEWYRIWSLLV